VATLKSLLETAYLTEPVFIDTKADLNVYMTEKRSGGGSASASETFNNKGSEIDFNAWAASYRIFATRARSNAVGSPPSPLLRWWDAFPQAKSVAPRISRDEVVNLLRDSSKKSGTDYAIIDVRRDNDGRILGSFQHPAQAFCFNLNRFHVTFGDVPQVIFYCGNSNGRAPRCASWYNDYCEERQEPPRGCVLDGGWNGGSPMVHCKIL